MASNFHYNSITEVSELIRRRELSPVELTKECLNRIERLQPTLNAFITVMADQALKAASKAETEIGSSGWKGPLHGIPIGVKDFFDTAGIKTTAAFEQFKDRVPKKDAEVVVRLKDAGAILVGKLNMHTLGMGTTSLVSSFGPVHNPWNPDYVAGGSSGGSAAAVAAGLCFATVDTDAIGSCRLPAAICGNTGFKATFGLISTKGILEGEKGGDEVILNLSHAAFQCRTAEDAALLLNALAASEMSESEFKADYRASFGSLEHPKIGVVTNYKATEEVRAVFQKALETLEALGYEAKDIEAPLAAPSGIEHIDTDRKSISQTLFRDVDLLVLPTTADVTPTIRQAEKGGEKAVAPDNTYFGNYYGLPAVSVPCGFDKHGLPLGLQIVGPRWGEGAVLDTAHRFQGAVEWHKKHPPV